MSNAGNWRLGWVVALGFALLTRIAGPRDVHPHGTQPAPAFVPLRTIARTPSLAGAPKPRLAASYGRLPLSFEANQGQFDSHVQFLARGRGYTLALTPREATLCLRSTPAEGPFRPHGLRQGRHDLPAREPLQAGASLRLRLLHASANSTAAPEERLLGKVNYFSGHDPTKWRANVPTFGKVRYRKVYPGIDLTYYGNQRQLEYDFVVAPGADPGRIRFGISGARRVEVDRRGDLVLHTAGGDVAQHAPVTYQEIGGRRHTVASRFVLTASSRQVGFQVGPYDRHRSLVIDPVLSYSTYLGGNSGDGGEGIAVDSAGSAYITGFTNSTDFPTRSPLQPASRGADLFVTKLSPDGGSLMYSTYLGGSDTENVRAIAVDGDGNACVTGDTASTDFPTVHALLPTKPGGAGGTTAFVAKLNATGSALLFSTYLGGTGFRETGYGIAADATGGTYVAGFTQSGDFPTLHAFQPQPGGGSADGFVTKFNADGTLAYSSFLGGNGSSDAAFAIAIDPAGDAYVTGQTDSTNFPTRNALLPNPAGGFYDAFVTEVNAAGTGLVYSTYLGGGADSHGNGGSDLGLGIAADPAGNAYVTGETDSPTFPTTPGALQPTNQGSNAFVTKLSPGGGSLVYSTYFGGSGIGQCSAIAADANGNAYVTGYTAAADFPLKNSLQPFRSGTYAFVSSFDPLGLLVYSTLLGGLTAGNETGNAIAADASGNAYVTGSTGSDDFPTVNPFQPARKGFDAFIVKLALAGGPPPPPPATHFSLTAPATVTAGDPFSFTLTALDATNNPVPSYRGTLHFTSPDPQAVLPPDYTFTAADAGAHTFNTTLKTAGAQSITGTDTAKPTLTGSAPITVTAAAPADLRFGQQPTNAAPNAAITPPVTVKIVDAFGNTVTTANNSVTLALGANPGSGTLNGTMTVTAVNGVATFNNLSVDKPGNGYTLAPSGTGLPGPFTASAPFNIAAKPATHLSVSAPASASSGTPFDVTVTALDADNQTVTGYAGPVHWTSNDPQAVLPADYTFTAGDGGVHHFTVTLKTVGSKTITVTDKSAPSVAGSATVNVTEPVSFVVTTAADVVSASDGVTSLREAILAANAHPGPDTITFKIPAKGVQTITPTTPLPTITDAVVIDGYTQPGAKANTATAGTNAALLIEISGSKAGKGANGLNITTGGCTVRGLVINRFQADAGGNNGAGIHLTGSGGNTIAGCFLGTASTGKTAAGNDTGIWVQGAPGNQAGGATPAAANLISGNRIGMLLQGATSAGNTIQGNLLGTDTAGAKAVPNSIAVQLETSQNTVGPGNLLSGNTGTGVRIVSVEAIGNVVLGNRIGTNAAGSSAIPNQIGVAILLGSQSNVIGGTVPAARNVISGNTQNGIIIDAGTSGNAVQGNLVGTNSIGKAAIPNGVDGIAVHGSNNLIGGLTPLAGNVLSGNKKSGVAISTTGAPAAGNVVQGNKIGTDSTGAFALGNEEGVFILGPNSTVGGTAPGAGNLISGNPLAGIIMDDAGGVAQGNRVGTNAAGSAALPNGQAGISIGAANNSVGGASAGAGNLISGNAGDGIKIGNKSAGCLVQGNLIGTNATGVAALPNGVSGINLADGASGNLVGGTAAGARNVISGNKQFGILLTGATTTGNQVHGNYIGMDVTGNKPVGNGSGKSFSAGIEVEAPGTLIGGTTPGAGNVVSGNPAWGVRVSTNSTGTVIQGNYVGTNASGNGIFGATEGVNLTASSGCLVGGTTPGAGNLISGNATGVLIFSASNETVQGNRIGTNAAGTGAVPNGIGVGVFANSANVQIGGAAPGAGNLISGNTTDGVQMSATGAGDTVQGNFIGLNAAGTAALANGANGVDLTAAAAHVLIGGTASGARNVISGCVKYAILMADAKSGNNTVQGNYLGTNAAGSAGIANYDGLHIFSSNNQIGGTAPGAGNVVSASTATGILFTNGAINNVTQGNLVGTDATGSFAIPNLGNGIYVRQSDHNTIGGTAPGAGNLISGNRIGLLVFSSNCVVQGNRIGTNSDGTGPIPNSSVAVSIEGDTNVIGGLAPGAANLIAFNLAQGVLVSSGTRNAIRGNAIFGNGKLGIDLLKSGDPASGVTPNDAGDKDTGANSLQNHPVLTDVSTGPNQPLIKFSLNSTPNTKFVIDVYLNNATDPSGSGPGQSYEGTLPVTTDSAGNASVTIIPAAVLAGKYYTATASRDYGGGVFETSEFSNAIRVPGP